MQLNPRLIFEVHGDPSDLQIQRMLYRIALTSSARIFVPNSTTSSNDTFKIVLFVSPGKYRGQRFLRIGESNFCVKQREAAKSAPQGFIQIAVRPLSESELEDPEVLSRFSNALTEMGRLAQKRLQAHLHLQHMKTRWNVKTKANAA
jgi:hypothetical protein